MLELPLRDVLVDERDQKLALILPVSFFSAPFAILSSLFSLWSRRAEV